MYKRYKNDKTVEGVTMVLKEFYGDMHNKLVEGVEKHNGWRDMGILRMLERLEDEKLELNNSIFVTYADHDTLEGDIGQEELQAIIKECADVANVAMMIADLARLKMETLSRPKQNELS